VGKKTFEGGCSGRARLLGVLAGVAPATCTKWSDGVREEVGDDATGSGIAMGVRDDDGDAAGGIEAEGGVKDGVGDVDDAASSEAAEAPREVALREAAGALRVGGAEVGGDIEGGGAEVRQPDDAKPNFTAIRILRWPGYSPYTRYIFDVN
jgi:hypothetical protein